MVSGICLMLRVPILNVMNTPPEAFEQALDYSTICMSGLVFIYGYNIVSAVLRGMGDSHHPFLFISLAAVMNLVLDIVFVWGLDMGAGGAALATVIGQGVSFLCCAVFLLRNRAQFELIFCREDFLHWDSSVLGDLIRLGTPMPIFSIFTQKENVLVIAREYVPVAVLIFFGSACRSAANALINGSGNYRINFVTAILDGIILRIGLSLLFGLVLDMKYVSFWLGDAVSGFTPFVIGLVFYFTGRWKKGGARSLAKKA